MASIEEIKAVAQILMPILVAVIIPYFKKMNSQLQELNKQMALNSATLSIITKELDRMRDKQEEMSTEIQEVSITQKRCPSCQGR
jgi:uncharacterized protein YoxC